MGVREVLLTTGEIAALCRALSIAPPLMLPRALGPDVAADVLEARGLVAPGAPWHDALRVLADPGVVVTVHGRGPDGARYVLFGACPEPPPGRAALHQPLPGDLHRVAPVEVAEVTALALGVAHLTARPRPGEARFTVTAADFRAARERATHGDADGGVAVLRGAGVPSAEAGLFGSALRSVVAAGAVTVLRRWDRTRVEGTAVAWMDAGDQGLWRVEGANVGVGPDASGTSAADWYMARVDIAAVSADGLQAEVEAAFSTACGRAVGLGRSTRP